MQISIVMPVLNEATILREALLAAQFCRASGHELIVVDGDSEDGSAALAAAHADRVLLSGRGRARQMNAGARCAHGEVLLFLHADTRLRPQGVEYLQQLVRAGRIWGRFDVRLSGRGAGLRVVEFFMNLRSRVTGICTGDQAIFVTRQAFAAVGGYPEIALMEDIALSRALKRRFGRPGRIPIAALVSSRRWESQGVIRTVLLMWWLRLRYFFGADPRRLVARYYAQRGPSAGARRDDAGSV